MELDRDRLRNELLICFSSRLSSSSSSMKLSKSILSPGRAARDGGGPAALSSSVSRRLRSNGSVKGGASPFFTTTGKKRGCGFENPEPSSPKVTCIGQVRVKTKKKVKRSGSVSKRRGGEVSFRKMEQDGGPQECRNQRWVHLPNSICEALRAEFSCLFPCKSSCFSGSGRGEGKDESGCGAVFARWVVSVNDGEGGKRKEIELVVGGGEEEEMRRSSRRHVFEDIEIRDDDRIELKGGKGMDMEGEGGRVSICIPPKNALLLMRCRSDPIKMAALANANATRFNSPIPPQQQQQEEDSVEENVEICDEVLEQEKEIPDSEVEVCPGDEEELGVSCEEEMVEEEKLEEEEEEELEQEILRNEEALKEEREEVESNMSSFEALLVQHTYEDCAKEEMEDEESHLLLPPSTESDAESSNTEFTPPLLQEPSNSIEKDAILPNYDEENQLNSELETTPHENGEEPSNPIVKDAILPNNEEENQLNSELETTPHENGEEEEEQRAKNREAEEMKQRAKVLPECLLLMMCEPKLSMEVSKETWVCSTDFIRWVPVKSDKEPPVKRRLSIDSKEPPRAAMIEQKLVNAVAYEPFVLTRCKSEPMRTAAAKLMPESCFWKNAMRKLEPHRRGVGAAGIGF